MCRDYSILFRTGLYLYVLSDFSVNIMNFPSIKMNHNKSILVLVTGRCYYGESTARKIVYPDSADFINSNHDITDDGTAHTDVILDADLMFDFRSDAQFANDMRKYCERQKELSQEVDEY